MTLAIAGLLAATALATPPTEITPTRAALAQAMDGHAIVLLGEVHDNATQHALRAAALRQWIAQGARPAIAFEQFDRERQPDIDRARRERPGDADYLVAQAAGRGDWDWDAYRPFIALALEYDLPIVAANLSRGDAMRVAIEGWQAVFNATARKALALNSLPADFRRKHEDAIAAGHCNLLPHKALPAQARAQMARDLVMAQSIRPYVERGVVLLAGNGHVRRDVGVPFWLTPGERKRAVSIGLLEREIGGDPSSAGSATPFDVIVITERAERSDPCIDLAKHFKAGRHQGE